MTAQGLAVHLRVTERTVRRWIKSGQLEAVKRGRIWMIRREDGERLRLGELADVVDHRSDLEQRLGERERLIANLEGKNEALREQIARLEAALVGEQQRAARAEARLELSGAPTVSPARRAA